MQPWNPGPIKTGASYMSPRACPGMRFEVRAWVWTIRGPCVLNGGDAVRVKVAGTTVAVVDVNDAGVAVVLPGSMRL